MMTKNTNKGENPKKNLVNLVSLLSLRSGKNFSQLRAELNAYLGYNLTRSMFDNYFRQKIDLFTRYPEEVILGLIHCFLTGVTVDKRITPIEAFLIINWSKSSLNLIRKLKDIFEKELFEASLEVYLFELKQDDDERLLERLEQVETQIEIRCARRKDMTVLMQERLSADLLPVQQLIQRLNTIMIDLKH